MKKITLFFIVLLVISGCSDLEHKIVDENDYSSYLSEQNKFQKVRYTEEASFWKSKINTSENGYLYYQKYALAADQLFDKTGDISYLHRADSALTIASTLVVGKKKAPILLSLSSLAIKQHQFTRALNYCREAYDLTDEKYAPSLMMFDAYMELGMYDLAGMILKRNGRKGEFDVLVREAKFQDHLGDLDKAIELMEEAYSMVKGKENSAELWALSNLSDMYGHAGRIKDSYDGYLKVLAIDPNYLHALKGIGWVAFSHDHNTKAAKNIAEYIANQKVSPDMYLFMAELAEFENNDEHANQYREKFIEEATTPEYGNMYNKYLIRLYCDNINTHQKALNLAKNEIENRATPLTYSLQAYAYFKAGNVAKALNIIKTYVKGRTFEPEAVVYMGMIYEASGESNQALHYLDEAQDAAYELGPNALAEVESAMLKL